MTTKATEGLSQDQITTANRRRERQSKPVSSETETINAVSPTSLNAMLGAGKEIEVYGRKFTVLPIPLGKQVEFGLALRNCPIVFTAIALSWDGKDHSNERAAVCLNKLIGNTPDSEKKITTEDAPFQDIGASINIDEETQEAIIDFVYLVLKRSMSVDGQNSALTKEEIADLFDIPNYIKLLSALFEVNVILKNRF